MTINYALCLVTDSDFFVENILNNINYINNLNTAITSVQLRIKNKPTEEITLIAKNLMKILKPKNIPLIINDYVEIVKIVDAAGVHIGQNDMSYHQAREYLGNNKIIGLSIENQEQARACCELDVDYYGVGPVFATQTKLDASPPIGIENLRKIVNIFSNISKPVVAIGGIHENNIHQILQTGVAGVAVASAILSAECPGVAVSKLRAPLL
jgi:thiamine-phosphate pyrophosphorylase